MNLVRQGRENCLEGLTFVITGVFESIDREETKSLILKHGGKVTSNVTRMTKYLVAGRDCGQSKLDKVRRTLSLHSWYFRAVDNLKSFNSYLDTN